MNIRSHLAPHTCRRAFTLIELLVVIAIIALLIGILLPALGRARDSGRDVKCKANIRGIAQALTIYSNDYQGKYPPILDGIRDISNNKLSMHWYDVNRIGQYLPNFDPSNIIETNTRNPTVGGGGMICPNHASAGRSYAMNFWAASAGNWTPSPNGDRVFKPGFGPSGRLPQLQGSAFDTTVNFGDKMILVTEAWGLFPTEGTDATSSDRKWFAIADVAQFGFPGSRFVGGIGMTQTGTLFPSLGLPGQDWFGNAPEFSGLANASDLNIYVPWYRHPRSRDRNPVTRNGGANFAFVDGHVSGLRSSEVAEVQGNQSRSTQKALWSPRDPEYTNFQ